jgi:hypothetical protein
VSTGGCSLASGHQPNSLSRIPRRPTVAAWLAANAHPDRRCDGSLNARSCVMLGCEELGQRGYKFVRSDDALRHLTNGRLHMSKKTITKFGPGAGSGGHWIIFVNGTKIGSIRQAQCLDSASGRTRTVYKVS